MIKSMTGYGRAEHITKERRITVELKSVNHRYLDLGIKMPRKLSMFEGSIRNLAKQYISRGKVDLYITYEDYMIGSNSLKYNSELAAQYLRYLKEIADEFGLENDIRVSTLSRYPDVLTMEDASVDESAVDDQFSSRQGEGRAQTLAARCERVFNRFVQASRLFLPVEGCYGFVDIDHS